MKFNSDMLPQLELFKTGNLQIINDSSAAMAIIEKEVGYTLDKGADFYSSRYSSKRVAFVGIPNIAATDFILK